ncbi:MAG TPA: fibronectin type III domain-containing protein, partial [Iamia sp.]
MATTVTAVVVVTPAVVAAQIPEVQAAELAVTAPDAEGVRHVSWERWYPETGEPVVTAWLVEAPGIDPVETEPDAVGADLVGLSPTAVVDVEVTARTAAGDATPVVVESDPEVVPPSAAPSELDVRGTAVEGELAISWGDPAAIDPTIETVRLGWPTGFADVEVDDPQPYVLSGVPEGLAVEVTARSRSLVGWSPVAIAPPIAPGSPTAGPTGVSAEATGEPGTVTVSWGAVPSGGTGRSAISGFEITWPGGSESAGSTATELEIDGLEDGVPVVFSVAAANGAGPGVRAAASPVTPSGPPTEEPAGVAAVATGTSGVVSVSWDPFDEDGDGGSPVTGFEVQTGEQLVEVGASATEAELEDLVDGTEAVVEVRAVNANGPGPAASVEVVPEGPPSAAPDLTAVVATGDAGELEVRWDPLAAGETGGSAITGSEIDAGVGDPPVTVAAALDEVVLEGLVDGTEHPVRVRARNEHGAGPWSDVVEATPGTPPDPPHAIVVEAVTPTSLRIRWQGVEPDRQGSAPVDSYVISGAGPEVEVFYGYNAWVIEDLVPGQAYQLQMRARNAHGDGPRSAPTDPFVPGAPTAAPTDVAAEGTGVNGELRVTWT